jgi:hypothetical protein
MQSNQLNLPEAVFLLVMMLFFEKILLKPYHNYKLTIKKKFQLLFVKDEMNHQKGFQNSCFKLQNL